MRAHIATHRPYTAVDSERVYMRPGDLILTPSWSWHDHGNETDERVIWMDGLDIPLIQSLEAMFFQFYTAPQVPATRPANASKQLHGHVHLSPTWVKEKPQSSPLLLYSWDQTWEALNALRDHEGSPFDGIALEYSHPQTGGPLLPTMACWVQLLRPGESTKAHRHTGSAVYHVVKGEGATVIDGQRFIWGKGDVIALPLTARGARTLCSSLSRTRPCSRRWPSTTRRRSMRTVATSTSPRRSSRRSSSVRHQSQRLDLGTSSITS
ncbi:MAG: cupin domain-containing protein [Deltaproteobacteria bacterium]|nr:MAG: cupin domain-containing protein [Deltaproteobacteria bacterium]